MAKYMKLSINRTVVATRVPDGNGSSAVDPILMTSSLFHRRDAAALQLGPTSWGMTHGWQKWLGTVQDHVDGSRPDLTASQTQRLAKKVMISFSITWTREWEFGIPGRSALAKRVVQADARTYKKTRNSTFKEAVAYAAVKYVRNKCTAWLNSSYELALLKMTAVLRSSSRVIKAINEGVRTRSGGGNRRGHAPVWWNQFHPNTPWSPDAEGILPCS